MKPVGHHPRQRGGDDRAKADKEALDAVAARVLFVRQHVGDKRAKRLHAEMLIVASNTHNNPAAIQRVEAIRHENQRQRTRQSAPQQIRPTAAEAAPGVIAHVADDWLDEQAGERRGEPEQRDLIRLGAKIFINGAHVRHLQAPAELDAEKAEAHVPDLPET